MCHQHCPSHVEVKTAVESIKLGDQDYPVIKVLGQGGQGRAYLVQGPDGPMVAKAKAVLLMEGAFNDDDIKGMTEEIESHHHASGRESEHQNIAKFMGVAVAENVGGAILLMECIRGPDLEKIFEMMLQKSERGAGTAHSSPFSEITDDDIDALFGE